MKMMLLGILSIFLCSFVTTPCYPMVPTAQSTDIYEHIETCYVLIKVLGFAHEQTLIDLYKHSSNPHYTLSKKTVAQLRLWGINPHHRLTREIARNALKTTTDFNLITIERPFNDQTHRLTSKSNRKSTH